MQEIFDITEHFDEAVKAEAKGSNCLIVRELFGKNHRINGRPAFYELEHRWLSRRVDSEQDVKEQNYVCVLGATFQYFFKKEINLKKNLFSQFNLF